MGRCFLCRRTHEVKDKPVILKPQVRRLDLHELSHCRVGTVTANKVIGSNMEICAAMSICQRPILSRDVDKVSGDIVIGIL